MGRIRRPGNARGVLCRVALPKQLFQVVTVTARGYRGGIGGRGALDLQRALQLSGSVTARPVRGLEVESAQPGALGPLRGSMPLDHVLLCMGTKGASESERGALDGFPVLMPRWRIMMWQEKVRRESHEWGSA